MTKRLQSTALQDVYQEVVGQDGAKQEAFEQELVNVEAAQLLYDMRTKVRPEPAGACATCRHYRQRHLPLGGR